MVASIMNQLNNQQGGYPPFLFIISIDISCYSYKSCLSFTFIQNRIPFHIQMRYNREK